MATRMKRLLLIAISVMTLFVVLSFGASAYTYPSMPSDWRNVQVTVGDVTLPLPRYPDGSFYSSEKRYMTVEEQRDYGINLSYSLDLKGWECVGFARYVYAALFYKYPQDATMDTSLAYEYGVSYAYRNMIYETLGTKTLEPGFNAYTLKTLITSCQPGAVMRCGGHSMVVMAIYDNGLLVYDANFASNDEVDVRAYTWQSFVESFSSRGIQALHMPSYYPGYSYSNESAPTFAVSSDDAGLYEVYNCSTLNVRAQPSTSSSWVGGLECGTQVEVLGFYDGWAQIIYQGKTRWVFASYLQVPNTELAVTFEANGGWISFNNYTYSVGKTFGTLPAAYKYNRTFLGWSDGANIYYASSVVPNQSSMVLTAKWGIADFTDVSEGDWYAGYVETAYNRGVVSKGSTFDPSGIATRSMMVTALGRGYEYSSGTAIGDYGWTPYWDVPTTEYYSKYVTWGNSVGIVKGYDTGAFGTDDPVTREQMAEFMYRLAIYSGFTTRTDPNIWKLTRFYDWASISDYAQSAICWAVDTGILKGDDLGNVNPKNTATRAEMITMICRYMDYAQNATIRTSAMPEELMPETEESEETDAGLTEAEPAEEAQQTQEIALPAETADDTATAETQDILEPAEPSTEPAGAVG